MTKKGPQKDEQAENYALLKRLFCEGRSRDWHLRTIAASLLSSSKHEKIMECHIGEKGISITLKFATWQDSNNSVVVLQQCRDRLASLYAMPVNIGVTSREPKVLP